MMIDSIQTHDAQNTRNTQHTESDPMDSRDSQDSSTTATIEIDTTNRTAAEKECEGTGGTGAFAQPPELSPLFDAIASAGRGRILVSASQRAKIMAKVDEMLTYEPKVGILGKTGAGKSSLCNALFGRDICAIGHVEACTRQRMEVPLKLGKRGITLLDLPGVGEDAQRDREYRELYAKLMPELDLIVWLLKGDERAYAPDQEFYTQVIKPYLDAGKPFLIAISQVDKIHPEEDWDAGRRHPGAQQAVNIEAKREAVARLFGQPVGRVVGVSTRHRYGLGALVEAMVDALPNDRKLVTLQQVKPENVTPRARAAAEKGFFRELGDLVKDVTGIVLNLAKVAPFVAAVWGWFRRRR